MDAHIIQLDIAWEDKEANYRRVYELIEHASVKTGDLLVLPELFDVGFTLNHDKASDSDGKTRVFLQELADNTDCLVHGSRAVPDPDTGKLHNCATIVAPGQAAPVCEYAKFHPFSFGREGEAYAPGTELKTYAWTQSEHTLTVAPAICYDLRFPELFRLNIHQGAQVFVLGANWPSPRIAHWRALCIARAIENQAYVIAANRTGSDPHLRYPGNSIIINPMGEVIGELGDEETVLGATIDPDLITHWRSTFPALSDMKLI
ncbi:MAG: nitrilase-related carbon-nitrogen hydrolase [Phycisphaerales bacterium]